MRSEGTLGVEELLKEARGDEDPQLPRSGALVRELLLLVLLKNRFGCL